MNSLKFTRFVGLALASAVVFLGGASIASAAVSPMGWSAPNRIENIPPYESTVSIHGMSCFTTSGSSHFCVGVDQEGQVLTTPNPTGPATAWTIHRIQANKNLTSVSCVPSDGSATCVAVDNQGDAWTDPDVVGSPNAWTLTDIDGNAKLSSVSCVAGSPVTCVATDNLGQVLMSTDPTAASPTWSATPIDRNNLLTGISCQTGGGGFGCVAVDNAGNVFSAMNPTPGSGWTETSGADPNGLTSVSCVGLSVCVATDDAANGADGVTTSNDPFGSSPTWTPATINVNGQPLVSVSCVADSASSDGAFCAAGDDAGHIFYTDSAGPTGGSGAWSNFRSDAGNAIQFSCVSDSGTPDLCVAGTVGPGINQPTLGGDIISSSSPTTGSFNAPIKVDGVTAINGIACPSASACYAVDQQGNLLTWSTTTGVPVTGASNSYPNQSDLDGSTPLNGISCPTTSFCVTVDEAGNILYSSTPGSVPWTKISPDPGHVLESVSCTADVSLCVAVDNAGNAVASTNADSGSPTWTVQNFDSNTQLNGVSCSDSGGAATCTAVDNVGNVFTSDSSGTFSSSPTYTDSGGQPLDAVSCPDTSDCFAVDQQGNLVSRTGGGAWTTTTGVDSSGFKPTAITCATNAYCIIVDKGGNTDESLAPGAGASAWALSRPNYWPLLAISCTSTTLCEAVDNSSSLIIGTPQSTLFTGVNVPEGTVTSSSSQLPLSGQEVSCPGNCNAVYFPNPSTVTVTLTATPAPGWALAGWTGSCAGQGTTCTLALGAPQYSATADFVQLFTLAAAAGGNGSGTITGSGINCPGLCTQAYQSGQTVTLTATPATGSTFAGWQGACTGTSTTCTILMNGNQSVVAVFNVPNTNTSSGSGAPGSNTGTNGNTNTSTNSGPPTSSKRCPLPSGSLHGRTLGPLSLGMYRKTARKLLPIYTVTYNTFDDFCLYGGWGIRAGYVSAYLHHANHRARQGHIVLLLSANTRYVLHGVTHGTSLAKAKKDLHLSAPIRLGRNTWYTAPDGAETGVVKVRHGVVQEVGIATKFLTGSHKASTFFLNSFGRQLF